MIKRKDQVRSLLNNIFEMKKILLIITLALSICALGQDKEDMKTALLIIDIQEFYFAEGKSQLEQAEKASDQASKVLKAFRDKNELVVHIRHASFKDSAIRANVKPETGEKVITKHYVNSYRETDLLDYLQQNEITDVVICGMMTHVCVEAAARASADYGFNVTVISDACATRDVAFGTDTVLAKDVHNSTLATMQSFYGTIVTTEEFLRKSD